MLEWSWDETRDDRFGRIRWRCNCILVVDLGCGGQVLVPSTSFLCAIESRMIDILVPLTPAPGGVNRAPLFLLLHLLHLLFRALWNDAGMTSDRHCVGMCVAVVDDFWPCGPMLYRPWVVRVWSRHVWEVVWNGQLSDENWSEI